MRKLIISMALLVVAGAPVAMAQTGNNMGSSGAANQSQPLRESPWKPRSATGSHGPIRCRRKKSGQSERPDEQGRRRA